MDCGDPLRGSDRGTGTCKTCYEAWLAEEEMLQSYFDEEDEEDLEVTGGP